MLRHRRSSPGLGSLRCWVQACAELVVAGIQPVESVILNFALGSRRGVAGVYGGRIWWAMRDFGIYNLKIQFYVGGFGG